MIESTGDRDMAYIVVYQAADGASGYEPCDSLQSAIQAAERMRNVERVDDPRIFRTEEVHFDFRPYYRIEVTNDVPTSVDTEVAPPLEPVFDSAVAASIGAEPASDLAVDDVVGLEDQPPAESEETDAAADGDPSSVEAATPAEAVASAEPAWPDEPVEVAIDAVDAVDETVSTNGESAEAPAEETEASTDEAPEEVADSVISPRRGLFGR